MGRGGRTFFISQKRIDQVPCFGNFLALLSVKILAGSDQNSGAKITFLATSLLLTKNLTELFL